MFHVTFYNAQGEVIGEFECEVLDRDYCEVVAKENDARYEVKEK